MNPVPAEVARDRNDVKVSRLLPGCYRDTFTLFRLAMTLGPYFLPVCHSLLRSTVTGFVTHVS